VTKLRFSANLGFLWTELPLPTAIHAAHQAGFDAVECHWPFDTDLRSLNAALAATGLEFLGLNTRRGAAGENGLAALVGRQADARMAIDEAITYAIGAGARNIHVMAGIASGAEAEAAFIENLGYATRNAAKHDKVILIEPLNQRDNPGYFLTSCAQARRIINAVGSPNLKLMFDCYHIAILEGAEPGEREVERHDLTEMVIRHLDANQDIIGHIQFAGVPDRGPPDSGCLDYETVFAAIRAIGYDAPLGAEYRPPNGQTEPSLGWLGQMHTAAVSP